ncbi:unnamed protein product [Spirodela intermedia]|uniref:HPP transmembrane region domain-containing protein n=1 Tax=Spirodela intermedia TaxID=51605 RepID=A0A7I8L391_SPIIN|nr:unnamed protein product [Spirodela intermedia]
MAMVTPLRLQLRVPSAAVTTAVRKPSPLAPFLDFPPIPRGLRLGAVYSGFSGGDLFLISLRGRRRQSRAAGAPTDARCCSTTAGSGSSWWEDFRVSRSAFPATRLSDVIWPSAGAFLAMALLGKMDQMIAPTGLSFTIAPLGAVCAVLFATPATPGARKYNMFMAQIGCAAFGVLALYLFGPGWLARSTALAASVAFMIATHSVHPPAAGLPIMFIDGAKFHSLHFWYILFPGATGCILLCLIQELVDYLKENYKF